MQPRIKFLVEKKLIGSRTRMSFAENTTRDLWRGFMPRRNEIIHRTGPELFSVEVYDNVSFFENFNPEAEFEKWAAVEVSDLNHVPVGMETLLIPAGIYAVFIHKGAASEGQKTYQYIFRSWLPGSNYLLGNRPHFALMGDKYKNDDPDSEEEIWIPVKLKVL